MQTDQRNNNQSSQNKNMPEPDTSNTQNNNGTLGREVEEEKKSAGSFKDIGKNTDTQKPANDSGTAENEENHWSRDTEKKSSGYAAGETDPNDRQATKNTTQYPKKGYNHVDNPGGTSKEMEEGRSGINISDKDEEDDPLDADGSRL